ncbi:MAG TPA: hypothetical protein VKG92_04230 [Flavobacteriales bacterium]|nr:hypothetical protein [Flavobacteriales bacterium]
MNNELSKAGGGAIARYLDRAEVLQETVAQLTKDLALPADGIHSPGSGEAAFEELRAQVLPVLEELQRRGASALQVAMYRVDIPEAHLRRTMTQGGLEALAGECVLRALQKVLTRHRFAGRF